MATGLNASVKANAVEPAVMESSGESQMPQAVQAGELSVDPRALLNLGGKYRKLFERYASERVPVEQRWLKNLRQYLGQYDPDVERKLPEGRSKAYPRLTRVKCITLLARIMNLMFPGNEDNWELKASPSPEMDPLKVAEAVQKYIEAQAAAGQPAPLTQALVDAALREFAEEEAAKLSLLLKDQFNELGGDQTTDWVTLNRKVCDSGIKYGIGVLEGPFVRKVQKSGWVLQADQGFKFEEREIYKPQYDFLPVWDFYPDLTSRCCPGDGYFVRKVLGRAKLRALAKRPSFMEDQIKKVISEIPGGNFKAQSFEHELRAMGTASHSELTTNQNDGRERYEVIVWKGPVSAQTMEQCGVAVPESMKADHVQAEIWMVGHHVIRAILDPWTEIGADMRTVHVFNFDEDDTSPVGQGLPFVMRDSQLSICAATRMMLDNASVTCGPNLEVNTSLMRTDQDLTAIEAYKVWYRNDDGLTAQYPAVRRVEIDNHLGELQGLNRMFMEFMDYETLIGPGTGTDMTQVPSEAMRTAAGGSMLRGDASLPFKDIVRNYDTFTQSVIWSMVTFNKIYNPDETPEGDFDVIPRGATSLIAKEIRGTQLDYLSQTLTEEERDHVDTRKFVEAKFAARDLQGILVSKDEAARRTQQRADMMAQQKQMQDAMMQGQIKKLATEAFKDVTQGQKNAAAGDKTSIEAASKMAEMTEIPTDGAAPLVS